MIRKYVSRKLMNLSQIFDEPRIISAMFKGISPSYVRDLFTIKRATRIIPRTIIDVGGHFGETTKAASYVFPEAKIYSFEPVPDSFNILKKETKTLLNVKIYDFALGNSNKKCNIWYNNFSAASSLLDTKNERNKIFNVTKNKKKINIRMKRFDVLKSIKIDRPLYLKIDVEGAEKMVLEGMGKFMKEVDILQVEYNFKDLYEGQTKLNDVLKYSELAGLFSFIQLNNHVTEKEGIVYCDLIFFRKR